LFLISGIFILVNFLYFTNLIPPIPLSLKDGGIYHSLGKNPEGNYEILTKIMAGRDTLNCIRILTKVAGEPVYAYSAVFSPQNLNLTIVHEWQYYDEAQNKWITGSVIKLAGSWRTGRRFPNLFQAFQFSARALAGEY